MTCKVCGGNEYVRDGDATRACPTCVPDAKSDSGPAYYKKGEVETWDYVIDVVRDNPGDEGFLAGNVIKYVSRYRDKHENPVEDLTKAKAFLNKLRNLVIAKQLQAEINNEE